MKHLKVLYTKDNKKLTSFEIIFTTSKKLFFTRILQKGMINFAFSQREYVRNVLCSYNMFQQVNSKSLRPVASTTMSHANAFT